MLLRYAVRSSLKQIGTWLYVTALFSALLLKTNRNVDVVALSSALLLKTNRNTVS